MLLKKSNEKKNQLQKAEKKNWKCIRPFQGKFSFSSRLSILVNLSNKKGSFIDKKLFRSQEDWTEKGKTLARLCGSSTKGSSFKEF